MHDSPATCVWAGLALWGVACLGELRLMGQATYACALWVSLFTLPLTYTICRTALDALVAEGLALAAQLLSPSMPCCPCCSWQTLLPAGTLAASFFARCPRQS